MDAGQWQQIKAAFSKALELMPEERSAFVESLNDPVLRGEVASLLASHREADDPMEVPAVALDAEPPDAAEHDPWVGKDIGVYHVISRIGRGGMGVVYRAVRVGDHFLKHVALKVVRSGIDSQDAIRRFKNERQILASLEHANIARLLDVGATESGLPYLIMEYIEGRPVDEYCDSRRLTIRERLRLFQGICAAVQFAHQNLVVHRDIKPGNILVTEDAVPKLLDFGIAKLLEPQLYFQTADPTLAFRPMTPEYASPEQIRGDPITTSSDIYALGVVLYLLMTGHLPYRVDRTPPHELPRTILETEPERPSTVLRRVEDIKHADGQTVHVTPESVAAARGAQPAALRRHLSGDLDNIVLKALRKDPARRYISVAQLSEDIGRHLQGLPVMARKDTLGYRASKFVRRHRIGVAAVATIFIMLIAGMITTTWQARAARAQREIATRRFEDVRALASSLIFDLHDAIQDLPGSTQARQLLVRKAVQYLDNLAKDPENDRALQRELATAYQKLGDVQGYIYGPNLGDTTGAAASYGKALHISESLSRANPEDIATRQQLARLYQRSCAVRLINGDLSGALELAKRSLTLMQGVADSNPDDRQARYDLAAGFDQLGDVFRGLGRREDALACHRKEQAIFEELGGNVNSPAKLRRALSVCYKKIGLLLEGGGDLLEARRKYEQALTIDETLVAGEPMNSRYKRDLSISYSSVAGILTMQGSAAAGLERYRKAQDLLQALAAADPADVRSRQDLTTIYLTVGDTLSKLARFAEARKEFARGVAIAEEVSRIDPMNVQARARLAAYYQSLGLLDERAASGAKDRSAARRNWIQARYWYERSRTLLLELRKENAVAEPNHGTAQELAGAIARCDAALRR